MTERAPEETMVDDETDLAERILQSAADPLIFADRTGTIRRWNRAAAALFGFSAEEALGQSLELIIPERLRAAHWRGFDTAMASGALKLSGRPTLTRAQAKGGQRLYIEMTFAVVSNAGSPDGAVAMARDVTERVERERVQAKTGGTA
jgi:PAS domain S-box-containing protein